MSYQVVANLKKANETVPAVKPIKYGVKAPFPKK